MLPQNKQCSIFSCFSLYLRHLRGQVHILAECIGRSFGPCAPAERAQPVLDAACPHKQIVEPVQHQEHTQPELTLRVVGLMSEANRTRKRRKRVKQEKKEKGRRGETYQLTLLPPVVDGEQAEDKCAMEQIAAVVPTRSKRPR